MTVQELIEKLKAFPPHWTVELKSYDEISVWLSSIDNVTNKKEFIKKYGKDYTELDNIMEVVAIY